MDRFAKLPLSHWNPISFSSPMEPVYQSFDSFENRVINTRNPFSRIQSGWNDKYNLLNEYESHKEQFEKFWNVTDQAEEDAFEKPEGIHNSFRAFLRTVLTSKPVQNIRGIELHSELTQK